jgi:hypothetical protein
MPTMVCTAPKILVGIGALCLSFPLPVFRAGNWLGGEEVSFLESEDGPEELLAGLDADALLLARLVR